MKKLIYLSLLAIVVLSGCKGNSFMTQRYTKFGQACHRTRNTEKAVSKTQIQANAENFPENELVKNEKEELVLVSSNSFIKENTLARIPVQIYPTGLILNKPEVLDTKDSKQVNKSQKTSHEKKQAAEKIIGTVLKIVLWIVILAVVVGVFLIIAAVA